jgi:hypothetical protein
LRRSHFIAFYEVAMKGRQRNRGEFTSWPTMSWTRRREEKKRILFMAYHGVFSVHYTAIRCNLENI